MKKLLLLCVGLVLLSCSKDDSTITAADDLTKRTETTDTNIVYHSPYNYFKGYLEEGFIDYIFSNQTDLDFSITPYFGLAYYSELYPYHYADYPFLNYNNQVYGNYLGADEITVPPHDMTVISSLHAVPTIFAYPQTNMHFNFPSDALMETGEFTKRGKLFYIEFSIDNSPTIGKVKIPFPYLFNSETGLRSPWRPLPYTDNVFADELIYNEETWEVCSTINPENGVRDFLLFSYKGKKYKVSTQMSENKVGFELSVDN